MILFPLTTMAGCTLILLLAEMTPSQKTMAWLGRNTLILMCLNGVFYHYINPGLAKWMLAHFTGSAAMVKAAGSIVTLVSLGLCIPIVFLLNKTIPQLVGKPKTKGPLLKNFL